MALFGLFKSSKSSGEMSFWSHIDALRGHLFRSALVVITLAVVLFCFPEFLFDKIIFGPLQDQFITYRAFCKLGHMVNVGDDLCFGHYTFKLQSLGLADQFTSQMWIAFLGGLIIGAPYVLWEVWRFIKPALKENEARASSGFIISTTLLFVTGVLFSYYIIVPLTINFLGNYQVSNMVQNNFTMDSYISTVTTLTIAAGLVFELPVLVYFLSFFGLMTPQFMRKYRKHAFVVILIVAGVITPSPDITSQLLVAFPLYFLYEASIFVSYYAIKKKLATDNN
ncbi:MAG TPA: twin-arginine translocase subunit TatC [Bacteroidia bacterium]|jgi:sec-independent protein translocase protein TatC|nr:twin-arginine translocase subunit TatC [Bacteroidia bacterium]